MKLEAKIKALKLRAKGYSIKEISQLLSVAKSSVSIWVRNVRIDQKAKRRLLSRIKIGQYNAGERKKAIKDARLERLKEEVTRQYSDTKLSIEMKRILCACIYWCEGAKDDGSVAFTNSDPHLTNFFLELLIDGYGAERAKFVARLHLHEYHDSKKQERFWQNVLKLEPSQFRNAYRKPHTGKRYRTNYPGCISLRYYDSMLARKLMFIAQIFTRGHSEMASYLSPKETF